MRPPLLSNRVRIRSDATPRRPFHERSMFFQGNFTRDNLTPFLLAAGVGSAVMGSSVMTYLVEGVAPVTPGLGVALSPIASSLAPIESILAAGSGNSEALTI